MPKDEKSRWRGSKGRILKTGAERETTAGKQKFKTMSVYPGAIGKTVAGRRARQALTAYPPHLNQEKDQIMVPGPTNEPGIDLLLKFGLLTRMI